MLIKKHVVEEYFVITPEYFVITPSIAPLCLHYKRVSLGQIAQLTLKIN
jgi:hypothetical protein